MNYFCEYESPLGKITIGGGDDYIGGLWFEGQKYFAAGLNANAKRSKLPVFSKAENWLNLYFAGKAPKIDFPLFFKDTDFRVSVWNILMDIPYGETCTYKNLADKLSDIKSGYKTSARAVGGAVGHNPISIIVPCHRVVGSDKSFTGYAGGIERKTYLLSLENRNITDIG